MAPGRFAQGVAVLLKAEAPLVDKSDLLFVQSIQGRRRGGDEAIQFWQG